MWINESGDQNENTNEDIELAAELKQKSDNIANLLKSKTIYTSEEEENKIRELNIYMENLVASYPENITDEEKMKILITEIEQLQKQRIPGKIDSSLEKKISLVVMTYNSLKGWTGY